jgi:hypothetical protein
MQHWRAAGATGGGEAVLEFGEKIALSSQGALTLQQAELTGAARADLQRRWPQLGGTPFAAFMETSAESLDRALRGFTVNAPIAFTLRNDEGMLSFSAPVEAHAASGAIARFRPLRSDAPMFRMKLGDGITNFSGVLEVGGGGLPITILTIDRFSRIRNEPIIIGGSFVAPDWRARPAAELGATNLKTLLTIRDGSVDLRVVGPLEISGPAGAAEVRNLVAPLDLAFHWGRGFRLASYDNRCMNVRFGQLSLPGVELANGAAAICPVDGAFFAVDPQGRAAGGFALASPSFSGHIAGEPAQRTQLGAQRIIGRFSGNGVETTLDVAAEAPRMNLRLAEGRDVAIAGARLTAQSRSAGGSWRAEGVLENGEIRDPALPANVGNIAARWTAEPRGGQASIRILEATARLTDRQPQDAPADHRSRFNPLLLTGVSADLVAGRVVGRGDIRLEQGERALATFEAVHDLESASGQAHVRARNFVFSKDLQPFEISELLRGVIEKVEGPLEADVDLDWTPGALTGTGRLATTDLSLASATLPVVRGVAGEIVFSDIFTLSTPPAQRLSIRELNPGVEVRDGVVQFQLLGDGRVAIESASWPFAGGNVSVAPGTVTLGSRETRLNLLLRDIDVALLLQHLKAPDLTATGRVEGEFPLLLTSTAALVEQGTLRAAIGGGTIAYVGRAREEARGIARIAFEALSSFRYDSLALELNGDLGGDVIAAIVFTGRNQAALNMTSATPGAFIPVVGRSGIPFKFNVRITAPFRTLAQTAAGISDPGIHVRRALDPVLTPPSAPAPAPATVDPPAPSPR